MWFFFLNKNKPKGWLGIVVPDASLGRPAPEEYGCLKRLDHSSRRAPRPFFSALASLPPPCANLGQQGGLAVLRGRLGGVSRGAGTGLRHSGRRCWEGAVAGLPPPRLTPSVLLALGPPGG